MWFLSNELNDSSVHRYSTVFKVNCNTLHGKDRDYIMLRKKRFLYSQTINKMQAEKATQF